MEKDELNAFKVVVIGGSAGSLDIILRIINELPPNPHACFIVVVHRRNEVTSILADLIFSRTAMRVSEVEDKEQLLVNNVYLAPPDYHLLVENQETLSLDSSEKINYSRPSIDVTFESVSEVFGRRVIAVLLTGANADGATGMQAIRRNGGYTIVQDPASAEMDFMPREAIDKGNIDAVVPGADMPQYIARLLTQ